MALPPSAHLHLEWIKKHPGFVPDIPLRPNFKTYFDDMQDFWTWNTKICPGAVPMMADRWLLDDVRLSQSYDERLRQKCKDLGIAVKQHVWFATLNFPDSENISVLIPKIKDVVSKILSFDWVTKCRAVFEYHGSKGTHPHVHLLITTPFTKSKVVEKLWATGGIKVLMNQKKNFVQVQKETLPSHHKYILLDKEENKMPLVAKDIVWRRQNSIPEFYEK